MKKLLVILMLGAGFVTVASADEPFECYTNPTAIQCCIDVTSMQSVLGQYPYYIRATTADGNIIAPMSTDLINDGANPELGCVDEAVYLLRGHPPTTAAFVWQPGNWINTIQFYR